MCYIYCKFWNQIPEYLRVFFIFFYYLFIYFIYLFYLLWGCWGFFLWGGVPLSCIACVLIIRLCRYPPETFVIIVGKSPKYIVRHLRTLKYTIDLLKIVRWSVYIWQHYFFSECHSFSVKVIYLYAARLNLHNINFYNHKFT